MPGTLHYGGSFDPIHVAHLACSKAAARAAGYDSVTLVPSWRSPHKLGMAAGPDALPPTPVADRLAMCRLAIASDPFFMIDRLEAEAATPAYTIDTVRELKRRGAATVSWLIGGDQLVALPRWRDPQALIAEARLVVMGRPGYAVDWSSLPGWMGVLRENVVEIPQMDVSATAIRARVRRGESIAGLVPDAVERYIREKKLFQPPAGAGG